MDFDYECETCTRIFANQSAANQHMNALNHWAPRFDCESCGRDFASQNAANQHMNAVNHWKPRFECETCTAKFHSQVSASDHMRAAGHWAPRYPCEACETVFRSQQGAREHMESHNHWRVHYCNDCDRGFQNQNNLSMVGVQAVAAHRSQGQELSAPSERLLTQSLASQLSRAPSHPSPLPVLQDPLYDRKRRLPPPRILLLPQCQKCQSRNYISGNPVSRSERSHHEKSIDIPWPNLERYRHGRNLEWSRLRVLLMPPMFHKHPRSGPASSVACSQAESLPLPKSTMRT
jgi:hypothetical protein